VRFGHTGVVWIRTLCVGASTSLVTLRSDVRNRAGCRRRVALYPGDTPLTSPTTRQRESAQAGVVLVVVGLWVDPVSGDPGGDALSPTL
jgi:hypothetical protein